MCSTVGMELARLCLAIEELADDAASGDGAAAGSRHDQASVAADSGTTDSRNADSGTADSAASDSAATDAATDISVAARLAALWAMVAEADPEMARRLPGYLSAAE